MVRSQIRKNPKKQFPEEYSSPICEEDKLT